MAMVQPERLSGWLRCITVCTFDIDVGQRCDRVFPRGALSPAEKKSIAYMAFPDSAGVASDHYDACFGFRLHSPATEDYVLGATFFRQQADKTNKRGFSQRAVVVVGVEAIESSYRWVLTADRVFWPCRKMKMILFPQSGYFLVFPGGWISGSSLLVSAWQSVDDCIRRKNKKRFISPFSWKVSHNSL